MATAVPGTRVFPPSSDMVEFQTNYGSVWLYCLHCRAPFGTEVEYLNEAITQWYVHVDAHRKKAE